MLEGLSGYIGWIVLGVIILVVIGLILWIIGI